MKYTEEKKKRIKTGGRKLNSKNKIKEFFYHTDRIETFYIIESKSNYDALL